MKLLSTTLITIFLLTILSSFAIAQPPFQTTNAEKSIQIEVPIIEYHPLSQNYTFHAHPHNSSDGTLISQDDIEFCLGHLYNPQTGDHIIQSNLTKDTNGIDWDLELDETNFTTSGQYAIYFYCQVNKSLELRAGFTEYYFYVTEQAGQTTTPDSLVRIFLVLFFSGLIVAFYYSTKDIDFEAWNNKIMKKYEMKNFVKLTLAGLLYNIMKNDFIVYYLLGLPLLMTITDITKTYNIVGLITITQVFLFIYTIGIIVMGVVFLSFVQEWFHNAFEQLKEMNWGIEK